MLILSCTGRPTLNLCVFLDLCHEQTTVQNISGLSPDPESLSDRLAGWCLRVCVRKSKDGDVIVGRRPGCSLDGQRWIEDMWCGRPAGCNIAAQTYSVAVIYYYCI